MHHHKTAIMLFNSARCMSTDSMDSSVLEQAVLLCSRFRGGPCWYLCVPGEDSRVLRRPDHHGVRRHQCSYDGEAQEAKVNKYTHSLPTSFACCVSHILYLKFLCWVCSVYIWVSLCCVGAVDVRACRGGVLISADDFNAIPLTFGDCHTTKCWQRQQKTASQQTCI